MANGRLVLCPCSSSFVRPEKTGNSGDLLQALAANVPSMVTMTGPLYCQLIIYNLNILGSFDKPLISKM